MKKYYLSIEIRYSIPEDEEYEGYQQTCFNHFIHSEIFENKKDCIDYGNSIIKENLWMEQFPGHIGDRLNDKFSLVAPSLKNGARIFIKVNTMNVLDFDHINIELKKFDKKRILSKIT